MGALAWRALSEGSSSAKSVALSRSAFKSTCLSERRREARSTCSRRFVAQSRACCVLREATAPCMGREQPELRLARVFFNAALTDRREIAAFFNINGYVNRRSDTDLGDFWVKNQN